MRIGEVNQNNYKQFLALLGIKNSKALDSILSKDEKGGSEQVGDRWDPSLEEGMLIPDDSGSWKKIVPVSDEVREKIIATVRKQFLAGGNGLLSAADGNEVGAIKKEYRKNIPPDERLSVTWTLSKIYLNEAQRLADYIKSQDPTWNYGQRFDKNILLNSNFGEKNVDVKV